MIPRHPAALAGLGVVVALATVSCASGTDASPGEPMSVSHVHALAADPEDPARVLLATHEGLGAWSDEEGFVRVSRSAGDFMGFAAGSAGTLYGSGHPGLDEVGPTALGLIASEDGGLTWAPLSLSGEADFHALTADADGVVGYDATSGRLRSSTDGRTWRDAEAGAGFLHLTADPTSTRVYGTTPQGTLVVAAEPGGPFREVPGAPDLLLVEVFPDGSLLGVRTDGALVSGGPDERWTTTGARTDDELQALAVGPDATVWLFDGQGLSRSDDRGAGFEVVARRR